MNDHNRITSDEASIADTGKAPVPNYPRRRLVGLYVIALGFAIYAHFASLEDILVLLFALLLFLGARFILLRIYLLASRLMERFAFRVQADTIAETLRRRGWTNLSPQDIAPLIDEKDETLAVMQPPEYFDSGNREAMSEIEFFKDCLDAVKKQRAADRAIVEKTDYHPFIKNLPPVAILFTVLVLGGSKYLARTSGNSLFMALGVGLLALLALFLFVLLVNICSSLKEKGYHWIQIEDAWILLFRTGLRAYKLPPRDESATLPGYRDYDVLPLILLAWKLND